MLLRPLVRPLLCIAALLIISSAIAFLWIRHRYSIPDPSKITLNDRGIRYQIKIPPGWIAEKTKIGQTMQTITRLYPQRQKRSSAPVTITTQVTNSDIQLHIVPIPDATSQPNQEAISTANGDEAQVHQCVEFVGDEAAVDKFFMSGEKGKLKGAHALPYAAQATINEDGQAVVIMVSIADDAHIVEGKRIFKQVVSSYSRIR